MTAADAQLTDDQWREQQLSNIKYVQIYHSFKVNGNTMRNTTWQTRIIHRNWDRHLSFFNQQLNQYSALLPALGEGKHTDDCFLEQDYGSSYRGHVSVGANGEKNGRRRACQNRVHAKVEGERCVAAPVAAQQLPVKVHLGAGLDAVKLQSRSMSSLLQ